MIIQNSLELLNQLSELEESISKLETALSEDFSEDELLSLLNKCLKSKAY
jgi:hypothetical protein